MARLRFAFAVLVIAWKTWLRRRRSGPLRPGWSLMQETMVGALRYNGERLLKLSAAAGRRRLEELALPAPRGVVTKSFTIGDIPARWFERSKGAKGATDATDETTILYFHGGGFVLGSVDGYRELLARLASTCRARILAIDYRLAPEHPFPAALDDCLAAYRWALANGIDARRLVLAGDSSGGSLVASTLIAARDAGDVLPRAAVLISPWVDLDSSHASIEANARFDWGDRAYLDHWSRQYLNGHDASDPKASPLHADLTGLPPLLVQVGTAELLHDQVRAFAAKARAQGVDVTLEEWPEMTHGWGMLEQFFPQARVALESIARFVR